MKEVKNPKSEVEHFKKRPESQRGSCKINSN